MDITFDLTPFGTVALGDLAKALMRGFKPEGNVEFDFCWATPDFGRGKGLRSYRGFYDHLAISWRPYDAGGPETVSHMVSDLTTAVCKRFTGYKGGEYRMSEKTPVWVDNWGDYTSTAIVGLIDEHGTAVLETKRVNV